MSESDWTAHAVDGVQLDIEAKLHQLDRMLADAKPVPLSASVMMNRAELEGLLGELRAAMPEELRQARWVMKERDEILDKARRESHRVLEDAGEERARLIAKTEVVHAAGREADRIVEEAQEQARQIRLEAEDYVDAKLANFEVVLHKTLSAVERGREKLRGHLDTDELAADLDAELDEG
jgi:F0F1-type ATP synthase membrane subunit b/b'